MSTELSTEIISHRLIIAWIWTKYVSKDFAEWIFKQLTSWEKTITIANPKTLTYIQKYRNEITLLPLEKDDKDIEYLLYISWLSEAKKEEVRSMVEIRKQEKKSIVTSVIQEIIESKK